MLIVGSTFPYVEFYPQPGQAKAVQIELDPKRIGMRYPVDVGLVGDSKRVLSELLPLLKKNESSKFLEQAQKGMRDWRELMNERGTRRDTPMKPQVVTHELNKLLDDDAIVITDSGTITAWTARHVDIRGDRCSSAARARLRAWPAACPTRSARRPLIPDRQVVAVIGDGSAAMLMGDFVTLRKYNLNAKIIVIKNNALGQIKWEQMVFLGNPEFGCELEPIDFTDVAKGCGIDTVRIDDPARCGEQLREALATPGPVPDRSGGRSVRAADAAEDRGEAGDAHGRSARQGNAARDEDGADARVGHGARAGVMNREPRLATRAPDGQVLREWDRYSAEAARALQADMERALGYAAEFDPQAKALYATDASNYRQVPLGVVYPRSRDEVVEAVRICREHEAPIVARGGGTSLAGQGCNVAVCIDFSRHLHHVIEIDPVQRLRGSSPAASSTACATPPRRTG